MPGFKKRVVKKVAFRKRRPTMKLARTVRLLKREVEGDKKFFDTDNIGSLTNVAQIYPLTDVPCLADTKNVPNVSQSTTSYYHFAKSIQFRALFNMNQSTQTQPVTYRVMIIQDKEVNSAGTAPVSTDILQGSTEVCSPLYVRNCKRFKVLYDKHLGLSPNGHQVQTLKFYKKLNHRCGIQAISPAGGAVQYVPRENNLYLLLLGDTNTSLGAGALNDIGFDFYTRYRFIDA